MASDCSNRQRVGRSGMLSRDSATGGSGRRIPASFQVEGTGATSRMRAAAYRVIKR